MSRSSYRRAFLAGVASLLALAGASTGTARTIPEAPPTPNRNDVVLDGGTVRIATGDGTLDFHGEDAASVGFEADGDDFDLRLAVEDECVEVRTRDGEAKLVGRGAAAGVVERGREIVYGSERLYLTVVEGVLDVLGPVGLEYDGGTFQFVGDDAIVRYDGSELAYSDDVLRLV